MPVSIDEISARLEAGEHLAGDEARCLAAGHDLLGLGMLADRARRRRHGSEATFVRVANVLAPDEAAPMEVPDGAGEVRIQARPATVAEAVADVVRARAGAGARPLSGFSLAHLEALSEPLATMLSALRQAGLELIAEAPLDLLQAPERALEAVRRAGLGVARLTIDQRAEDWVAVCDRVVTLQERLGSLRAFAPLARRASLAPTTGYEDVKRVALARLLVHNVATIQVDWALYGPKLAQVALTFGADDVDGVSPFDDESLGRRRRPAEEIRRSIQAASLVPVERNARFERV